MKILQINVSGNLSTGRIATNLARGVEKAGHECIVAYARNIISDDVKSIKIGNCMDVIVHGLGTRITDKHGLYSRRATKHFIEKVKKYNPDIVHLHNIHGYYINIQDLFCYLKEENLPVIWTMHDCWPFTGHCANFSYINCEKWKRKCEDCPQKKNYPASIIRDNSDKNYFIKRELFNSLHNLTIVSPSNWLAGLLKSSFLSEHSIRIIQNGIDIEKFRPRNSDVRKRYNLEKFTIILGVASEWSERKGLKTFIELSKMLPIDYKIILVGIDNRNKFNIPSNIITIAKTNSVIELAEIYSAADIFVNPTLEDNYPTVNIESLACGTPVITYKTGGSPETINKKCGIILEQNNITKLYEVLLNIKKYNFKEEDCIKSIANNTQKVFTDKYLHLYDSVKELSR